MADVIKAAIWRILVGAVLVLGACRQPEQAAEKAKDPLAERREQWFGESATAPDIVWRTSGLGMRTLVSGDSEGLPPTMDNTVSVHYTGRLKDGTVFADSRVKGKPEEFALRRLIPGWASALLAMKPGERAEVFIPPALGYGGMQAGPIPPNSGLIFDLELIAVKP